MSDGKHIDNDTPSLSYYHVIYILLAMLGFFGGFYVFYVHVFPYHNTSLIVAHIVGRPVKSVRPTN